MPGGLFSRLKVWIYQDSLYSADLNGELDNIISHLQPVYLDNYSHSVGEMQTQTSPGTPGSEVLPTSLAGELAALRYQLAQVIGASPAYWYSGIPANLTSLNSLILSAAQSSPNRIVSGAVSTDGQPMFLIPGGTLNKVTLKASITPIVVVINGTQYTFSSDIVLNTLQLAPSSNNTATIGQDIIPDDITSDKVVGEPYVGALDPSRLVQYQEYLPLASPGSSITALSGKIAAYKLNAEYGIGLLQSTSARMQDMRRGFFFDSAGAWLPRVACSTGDTFTLCQVGYIFLRIGGTLNATYNEPNVGPTAPSGPISGDYWYDTVNQQWKIYSSGAFVADNSVFVGYTVQDTTNVKGARAADFGNAYSNINDLDLELDADSAAIVRSKSMGSRVSAYGSSLYFEAAHFKWNITSNLDSGVTLSASLQLFLYLSATGKPVISNIAPHTRPELRGFYHPAKPWRCVGTMNTDGTNFQSKLKTFNYFPMRNRTLLTLLNTGALTTSGVFATLKVWSRGAFKFIVDSANSQGVNNGPELQIIASGAGSGSVQLWIQIGTTKIQLFNARFTATGVSTFYYPMQGIQATIDAIEPLLTLTSGEVPVGFGVTLNGVITSTAMIANIRIEEVA